MKPLKEIVGGVQAAESEAQDRVARQRAEAEAQITQAQANIAAGEETSGSKLHDGLVVLYGADLLRVPRIIENYERVVSQLEGKQGEPIVLVHHWTELHGCTGFGGKGERSLETELTVGVLNGTILAFDYNERTCALPTSKYAKSASTLNREPELTNGKLVVSNYRGLFYGAFDLGIDLDKEVHGKDVNLWGDNTFKTLTIAIGNEGIAQWLANDDHLTIINLHKARELCTALGIKEIEPVTPYQVSMVDHFD